MEENKVLKGFLIPFCTIIAVVIITVIIVCGSSYKQIEDTSGYGHFSAEGYSSETLGFSLENSDDWLYLNSDRVYQLMSADERITYGKAEKFYGAELILGFRRPFTEVVAEVNTKDSWSGIALSERFFTDKELPLYERDFAENGHLVTGYSCRNIEQDDKSYLLFVIESDTDDDFYSYSSIRFNSDIGGIEIYGECTDKENADELTQLLVTAVSD